MSGRTAAGRGGAIKRSLCELAAFGAEPAFDTPLHVGRPSVGDEARFIRRIEDILHRRWFTNGGPYVEAFEAGIAERVGVRHCVATCNATVGLEILLRALDLTGEVILPSFSFVATAHAAHWLGLTPVFCDVDPATHNLDPACVEPLITPRTSAIVGVHVWGRPCAVQELSALADRFGLALLFDAAHALCAGIGGQMVGSFGNAEVFSFHATKFVNAFEGGAITTNDDQLAARLRLLRNFGFADYDLVTAGGTNGKMSEVSAAMGLTSLESAEQFIAANRAHFVRYADALRHIPGIRLAAYDEQHPNNYQYVVLEIDAAAAGIRRDTLLEVLRAEGILARRYFYPGCHRMEPYRSQARWADCRLPATEWLADRVLQLPTGAAVTADQIARVCDILRFCVTHGSAIEATLADAGSQSGSALRSC